MNSCRICKSTWTGVRAQHCMLGCHQTFVGNTAADLHETGRVAGRLTCMHREALEASPDFVLNDKGMWTLAVDEDNPWYEKIKAAKANHTKLHEAE